MAGQDRRDLRFVILASLAALLWSATDLSLPEDVAAWRPGPLHGETVYAMAELDGELLAGTHTGLHRLPGGPGQPGGARQPASAAEIDGEQVAGVPGPVFAVASDGRRTLAATGDGVYRVGAADRSERDGLADRTVNDVFHRDGRWLAAASDGAYERGGDGEWSRRWPLREDVPVLAVAGAGADLLLGTRDGIVRVTATTDEADRVWDGGAVRSLVVEPGGRIWAGVLGGDLLLASDDGGRTWQAAGTGIRLLSVQDLRRDPAEPQRLVIGGTGVDDGTLIGGVMTSEDGGRTWRAEPSRLSNTHVYSLVADQRPLELGVSWPATDQEWSVRLPTEVTTFWAGTNGTGIYTYAVAPGVLSALAAAQPVMRVLEPVLLGAIVLLLAWRRAGITSPVPRRGVRRAAA